MLYRGYGENDGIKVYQRIDRDELMKYVERIWLDPRESFEIEKDGITVFEYDASEVDASYELKETLRYLTDSDLEDYFEENGFSPAKFAEDEDFDSFIDRMEDEYGKEALWAVYKDRISDSCDVSGIVDEILSKVEEVIDRAVEELKADAKDFAKELQETGYFGDDAYNYIGVYSAAKKGEQIDFLKDNEDKIADLPMPVYMWAANDDGSQSFYYTPFGVRDDEDDAYLYGEE